MELVHGNGSEAVEVHIGMCLTPDESSAVAYAAANSGYGETGWLHWIELDLTGLDVVDAGAAVTTCDGDYVAPGEDRWGRWIGWDDADVIVYDDLDTDGGTHRAYRLVTDAAVAACRVVCSEPVEED